MNFKRSSGILLHPSCLPGPYGIGDLGPEAYRWIDFLAETGIGLWEILPLGPTGYGNSPYQCFSAFAGNPYLISPDFLMRDGLLNLSEIEFHPQFSMKKVEFNKVKKWKDELFITAYTHFINKKNPQLKSDFQIFVLSNSDWLNEYSLFMAIKKIQNDHPWNQWSDGLRIHDRKTLNKFMKENSRIIEQKKFEQFVLSRQWEALINYTHSKQIKIIGDLPIFISYDSADVWTNPKLFKLTNNLESQVIAGVPPDYFSPTGQLWGNPLYRWEIHKRTQYNWWIKRFQHSLKMADIIRLDHFRGFAGFWEVPSSSPTAEGGYWVKGPGIPFFNEIQKTLGSLPFIAEDLGLISEDVVELRDHFKLPGMKILQFAFNKDSLNQYLPHNFPVDCVVFTGTHDNETNKGWFIALPKKEREFCLQYLNSNGEHIAWDMIRVAWSSVAVFALAPMQDFLELGSEARMNYPGHVGGNWTWRISKNSLKSALIKKIKKINQLYDRNNIPLEEKVELPKINYLNS